MIPFDRLVWDAQGCADYLAISKQHFLNAIQYAEGFPKPLPTPPYAVGGKVRKMDNRWSAAQVAAWVHGETAQDLHKSRDAA